MSYILVLVPVNTISLQTNYLNLFLLYGHQQPLFLEKIIDSQSLAEFQILSTQMKSLVNNLRQAEFSRHHIVVLQFNQVETKQFTVLQILYRNM